MNLDKITIYYSKRRTVGLNPLPLKVCTPMIIMTNTDGPNGFELYTSGIELNRSISCTCILWPNTTGIINYYFNKKARHINHCIIHCRPIDHVLLCQLFVFPFNKFEIINASSLLWPHHLVWPLRLYHAVSCSLHTCWIVAENWNAHKIKGNFPVCRWRLFNKRCPYILYFFWHARALVRVWIPSVFRQMGGGSRPFGWISTFPVTDEQCKCALTVQKLQWWKTIIRQRAWDYTWPTSPGVHTNSHARWQGKVL